MAKSIEPTLFFNRYFKTERRAIVKNIQSLFRIDSFLVRIRPNINIYTLVSDAWNSLKIEVITNSDTAIYTSQFWSPLGQPITQFRYKDFKNRKTIINLEANTSAQDFLPKESRTYQILDINNIKRSYIKWCLENYFK